MPGTHGTALSFRAAVLHALCDEEAVSLARLVPNVPICVIPNGIHLPELRDSGQLVRSGEVLLFLGRIHPKKGLEPLIEAWAQVPAAAQSGRRLAIAGWDDGGHQARLSAHARRLAIQDSVLFLGPTFGEAKERVLRSASAFILPSFSEGLPMSVLEAWSFAIPVVMTEECHLGIGFARARAIRVEPTVTSSRGEPRRSYAPTKPPRTRVDGSAWPGVGQIRIYVATYRQ